MKKKDIIQLVKETVKENTFYGNREQPSQLSTGTKVSVPTDEYPFSAKPKRTGTGMMDEEGESWGLEPRQLADSFTFEELEQLYNDNKISKEDLNGAKSYLQAWIDMHPTYLPQRDLTEPKRQRIRDKYLSENKELSDNPKLQPGKTVTYSGTRYEVIENSGYVLTLKSLESGKTLKLNLGQLKDRPIKENNMKKNIKEADLYTLTSTDGEEKQVSFPDQNTAMAAASKNANVKQVVKLEGDDISVSNEDMGTLDALIKKYNAVSLINRINVLKDRPLEEEPSEGNKFGSAMQKAQDAGENSFKLDGKTYQVNEITPEEEDEEENQSQDDIAMGADDAKDFMEAYIKERGNDNLMEHMDKYRKRATLMEGATEKLFKLFNAGKTDLEVRSHYLQMNVDMPESFIAKLRNNWESLRKTKLDLTLADKEAEGFEPIQQATPANGMEGGEIDGMEETKELASGLFTK